MTRASGRGTTPNPRVTALSPGRPFRSFLFQKHNKLKTIQERMPVSISNLNNLHLKLRWISDDRHAHHIHRMDLDTPSNRPQPLGKS